MSNKKLFWTADLESNVDYDIPTLTGKKLINVYQISDNQPLLLCEIESTLEKSSVDDIYYWLDNNGYEHEDFSLERL